VELFPWEKLDYIEKVKASFNIWFFTSF
jgi:hypothetical protein